MSELPDLSCYAHAQRERLRFIDACLHYFGQIARADLITQFQTGLASGTRDLSLYKELAPDNLELRHDTKLYYRTPAFAPLFHHDPDTMLGELGKGSWDHLGADFTPSRHCVHAVPPIPPKDRVLAPLIRAIHQQQAVLCDYVSLSSGEQRRELVPHTLVNNGRRWHVRAFDRRSRDFRDFVLNRFTRVALMEPAVGEQERREQDHRWQRILPLTLRPHPGLRHPGAIELDYGMSEGRLRLEVREALLGYLMQQWLVDCSADARLDPRQYPLALADQGELNAIADKTLLPGADA